MRTGEPIGRDGTVSDRTELDYNILDPQIETWGIWAPGAAGQPGWFDFSGDLTDVTVSYLWHVNDGPVVETPADPDGYGVFVSYTPTVSGENHLYVQRKFTDGALSPLQDVPFDS